MSLNNIVSPECNDGRPRAADISRPLAGSSCMFIFEFPEAQRNRRSSVSLFGSFSLCGDRWICGQPGVGLRSFLSAGPCEKIEQGMEMSGSQGAFAARCKDVPHPLLACSTRRPDTIMGFNPHSQDRAGGHITLTRRWTRQERPPQ